MRAILLLAMVGCSAAPMTRDDGVLETSEQPRLGLVGPFAKLGASCGSELPTGSAFACGKDHRIASLTIPFQQPPFGGVVRYRKANQDQVRLGQDTTRVMIDGTHVWLESSCSMCRMMMFSTTVVDLHSIDDGDLAKAQIGAGLPASPILRTAKAWDRATASWERFNAPSAG
jgi:hypothetical protein